MRSVVRYVVGGILTGILGVVVAQVAVSASSQRPTQDPAEYAIMADRLLRARGTLRVSSGAVGVNRGSLFCPDGLSAPGQQVSAQTARIGRSSTCERLFATAPGPVASGCPASPLGAFADPLVPDLGEACGFPNPFPTDCSGEGVTVGHTGIIQLGEGQFGPVKVVGGGAVRSGTLRLTGGTYVFCSLRLARGAGLLFDGPAQVLILGDLEVFNEAFVGPGAPASVNPAEIQIFVNGSRARISRNARFNAALCAPHALLGLGRQARITGRLFASVISSEPDVTVAGVAPAGSTTTSSVPATTTSTSRPPTTTTSSSLPPTTTTSRPPVTTTSTSLPTTTTSTSLPPTTTSTSLPPTTTSTSLPATTTTSSTPGGTTTTTTLPLGKLKVQFKQGTTSCGGAALYQHCLTGSNLGGTNGLGACTVDADCGTTGTPDCSLPIPPPAAPLAGRLNNTNGQKLADLGAGCLYFGGGRGTNVPGGQIPVNSSTIFAITGSSGNVLTLGPSPGTSRTDCSLAGGPGLVCFNNANIGQPCTTLGTDPACSNVANACNPTPNCYFGPPLPIPNPANRTTQTCVVNVVDNLPGTTTPPGGTTNTVTGELTVGIGLRSHVYLTATSFGAETPCPRCINNVCNGGKRSGQACTPGGSLGTSVDCMPNDNQWAAPLAISLSPLTTETASQTGPANGLFCPGQAGLSPGAFGVKLARQIVETGTRVAGGIGTTPHQMTIGATFCIGSVNGVINAAGDLPGPGAFSLVADVSIVP